MKTKTVKKAAKKSLKQQRLDDAKAEKISNITSVILGAIAFPFYGAWVVMSKVLTFIYKAFIQLPSSYSPFLGLFRLACMFGIINFSYQNTDLIKFSHDVFRDYTNVEGFVMFALSVAIIINSAVSLMVFAGIHSGATNMYSNSDSSGYSNIDEALDFRNGQLGMMTSREKMEELGKTRYINKGSFANMTENEREGIEFLNGQLGQCSSRDKYKLLKDTFSGK